ncbi:hypothetical protein [uncultured Mycobacterium sp.]|uniref:hypothetical protein n=1 Tax=uncultured Mycobacterium sp. TaxID=171292 RepID=UPI0035C97603
MSKFVLLGVRRFPTAELSPAQVELRLARAQTFVAAMRCWQLLDSHATREAEADEPRALLLMCASSPAAAGTIAAAWSAVTGFDVSVWSLVANSDRRAA